MDVGATSQQVGRQASGHLRHRCTASISFRAKPRRINLARASPRQDRKSGFGLRDARSSDGMRGTADVQLGQPHLIIADQSGVEACFSSLTFLPECRACRA